MKFTPSSTARLSTALASSGSSGSPQNPFPVSRIAPKPMRFTVRPSRAKVPALDTFSGISKHALSIGCVLQLNAFFPSMAGRLPVRWTEAKDAVVVRHGATATIAVARKNPEGPVGCLGDVAETTSFAPQQFLSFDYGTVRIENKTPEALAAGPRHKEVTLPLGDRTVHQECGAARGGFTCRPCGDGIYVLRGG